MWDVRSGKEVASQNIEADQTWFMDWPLWHDSKAVHIQFVNGYQTTRRGYTTVDRTTGAISTYDGTILYQGEKTLLVGRNASLNNAYDFSIADARTGTPLRSLPIERSNQFFAFSDILSGSRRDMLFVIENGNQLKQQALSIIDLASGEKLWSRKLPDDDFYGIVKTSFRERVVYLRPSQPYKPTGRFFVFDSMGAEVGSSTLPNSVFLDSVDAGDLGRLGITSYPNLGKTKFFNSAEWEDGSLVINRILGVSQGILVALYQERGQPPVLYRIDIKNQKRLGRPIRIEQGIGDIIIYKDKIVIGLETRNMVEVIDLGSGETVKQVSLPKRAARIFPTKIGNEKVVFVQIGFAPSFPGILGRSQKEEKGSLVAIRL